MSESGTPEVDKAAILGAFGVTQAQLDSLGPLPAENEDQRIARFWREIMQPRIRDAERAVLGGEGESGYR
jgi:hypothetical protein